MGDSKYHNVRKGDCNGDTAMAPTALPQRR